MVPTSFTDAWIQFQEGCGVESPVRTENDLRHMLFQLGVSYWIEGAREQPEGATEEAWGAAWEAIFETGWAWDETVPDEKVIEYYRQCLEREES